MSADNAVVSYQRSSPASPARPPILIVATVLGMLLSALDIVVMAMFPRPEQSMPNPKVNEMQTIGVSLGLALHALVPLVMFIGCLNCLWFRRGGRLMAIVGSYGWIILAALQVVITAMQEDLTSMRGPRIAPAALVIWIVIVAVFAIAIFTLVTLRQKSIKALFDNAPVESNHSPLPMAISISVIAVAAIELVELTARAIAALGTYRPGYHFFRFLVTPPMEAKSLRLVDLSLGMLLSATFIAGGIGTLLSQKWGRRVLFGATLAWMAFTMVSWGNYNLRGTGMEALGWNLWKLRSLAWGVLLLVILLHRSTLAAIAAGGKYLMEDAPHHPNASPNNLSHIESPVSVAAPTRQQPAPARPPSAAPPRSTATARPPATTSPAINPQNTSPATPTRKPRRPPRPPPPPDPPPRPPQGPSRPSKPNPRHAPHQPRTRQSPRRRKTARRQPD